MSDDFDPERLRIKVPANGPNDFDPERLRIKSPTIRSESIPSIPRPKRGETFIKGPIPEIWVSKATSLPGKALGVGLAIWMRVGMRSAVVTLSIRRLRAWGINRYAAYRGLEALEQAGLVRVWRRPGRLARVSLLHTPADPDQHLLFHSILMAEKEVESLDKLD